MLPDIELKKYFLNSLWIFKNLVTDEEMTIYATVERRPHYFYKDNFLYK